MSQWIHRIQKFSVTEYDREILADARAAIDRSLQILRDSRPETCLGRNYYAPEAAIDLE